MDTIPRMRTINECYDYVKKLDPSSKISKPGIRRMANSGEIPAIKSGRATLINLDAFLEYLRKGRIQGTFVPTEPIKMEKKRRQAERDYGGVRVVRG